MRVVAHRRVRAGGPLVIGHRICIRQRGGAALAPAIQVIVRRIGETIRNVTIRGERNLMSLLDSRVGIHDAKLPINNRRHVAGETVNATRYDNGS